MMKVVISPRGFATYGSEAVNDLKSKGIEVDYNDTGNQYTYDEFLEKSKDAAGIIVGVDKIDKNFIDNCPNLKVVCKFGVGLDNIDVDYAKNKNIYVGRTIGTNTNAVAEHVISLIFADAKNLYSSIKSVKENHWEKLTGSEVKRKTLGIIGFGSIGERTAELASSLGMDILAYDIEEIEVNPNRLDADLIGVASLENILEHSDYVSLNVPLTNDTRNLISVDEFEKMKPTACLVNTARGGVVDESALYNALSNNVIRTAYFDVFSVEPPAQDDPLLKLYNFILTPHVASRTQESEMRTCNLSAAIVADQLVNN